MQTLLPYANFARSARTLDSDRLVKQAIDCKQLVIAQIDPLFGWQTHRAKTMWNGHVRSLCAYGIAIIDEAICRGIRLSAYERSWLVHLHEHAQGTTLAPWWLGDTRLHSSHRAHLKRRNPHYYRAFAEDPTLLMWWPTRSLR